MRFSRIRYLLRKSRLLADILYLHHFHRFPHWKNPRDINEKINWQKFYGDTREWSRLADKYAVREYVEKKGLGHCLVNLCGKWDSPYEIDWDSLPDSFVLKMNNGSGDIEICRDKKSLDRTRVIRKFTELLDTKYSQWYAEVQYEKIKPCIIAEELLDAGKQDILSSSLIDYKFWCFGGMVDFIMVYLNRNGDSVDVAAFDRNWNSQNDNIVYNAKRNPVSVQIPRPDKLDEMIKIAETLSHGIPQVRIDLYFVDHNIYFGEMTLTACGGFITDLSQETLADMGSKVKLDFHSK